MFHRRLMQCWRLLLGVALLLTANVVAAQSLRDYPYVDSLTLALARQNRWAALDSVGRAALRQGTDYPALRQRLGFAAEQQGRWAAVVRHYSRALAANPADEDSRVQLALAYRYLNQLGSARLAVRSLPDSVRRALHLAPAHVLTQVIVETGVKPTSSFKRSTTGFGRLALSSQLSTRLALEQGVSYYGQTVQLPERGRLTPYAIRQGEYTILLAEQLTLPVQIKASYHFIYNTFGAERRFQTNYAGSASHLGYGAIRYSRPWWSAQAGFYAGRVNDTTRTQTDLQLTTYPLGNLHLYTFGRGSLVRSNGRTFPNALLGVGGQVRPGFWVEGFGSPGAVPVLFERDGTDVYNLLDLLRRRYGLTAYWQFAPHWRGQIYYVNVRYQEISSLTFYTQHSLTGSLVWTW